MLVRSARFSPDGDLLLVEYAWSANPRGGKPAHVQQFRLWSVARGKELGSYAIAGATCWAFLPGGDSVLAGGKDVPLQVCKAETGEVRRTFDPVSRGAPCLDVSRDGRLALTGGSETGGVQVWDVEEGKRGQELDTEKARAVQFSPDGKRAFGLFGPYPYPNGERAATWNVLNGICVHSFRGAEAWKYPRAVSQDGQFAVSDRWDDNHEEKLALVVWDVPSGQEVRTFSKREGGSPVDQSRGFALAGAFSPNGKRVASVDADGMLRLWSVATGKLSWSVRTDDYGVIAAAVSRNAQVAFSASGADLDWWGKMRLKVWDTQSGKLLHPLTVSSHQ